MGDLLATPFFCLTVAPPNLNFFIRNEGPGVAARSAVTLVCWLGLEPRCDNLASSLASLSLSFPICRKEVINGVCLPRAVLTRKQDSMAEEAPQQTYQGLTRASWLLGASYRPQAEFA